MSLDHSPQHRTHSRVALYPTGFTSALKRHPGIKLRQIAITLAPTRVTSVAVRPRPLRVKSYFFKPPQARGDSAQRDCQRRARVAARREAKVALPADTVRLQDRLQYLLQPPLASWLEAESLSLAFEPFAYQWDGIAFLYPRYGAVLADEMGLGKTMQAITAIRLLLTSGEVHRTLLVCPKPLVTNWQREFASWAPELPVNCIEGHAAKRHWQWGLENVPVCIANYELLVRDRDILTRFDHAFDLVVLDEAQRIKNRDSATSQVARAIPRHRSWALTGTPIENSTGDLQGIFEFVAPGMLSPHMTPRQMGQCARDYMLRRTKDRVLTDLPPKIFRDATIELTSEQSHTYAIAEESGTIRLSGLGQTITVQHVFELILRLKQICNFDPATGASAKANRLVADMEEIAASGRKAIVFSQWVQTLQTLDERLKAFNPLQFHGQIGSSQREAILQEFRENSERHVLLMSYGAGSVGLNLQFASYVFLFDRWWNPAVEDQAINRAHRIGASHPVTITRFLTAGTIEHRIDAILEGKRALFDAVISEADGPVPNLGLSQEEIFGLFAINQAPAVPTAA